MSTAHIPGPAVGEIWARIHDRLSKEDEERNAWLERRVRPTIEREAARRRAWKERAAKRKAGAK